MAGGVKQKFRAFFRCRGTKGTTSYTVSNDPPKKVIFRGSEENYIRNGRVLLEERISLFYGKTNPIRCLSVDELNTNFENWSRYRGRFEDWYTCVWEGRSVLVKLFPDIKLSHDCEFAEYQVRPTCREIAIATQMGIHRNVHKLLACCLETAYPVLVYEFVQDFLLNRIFNIDNQNKPPLKWNDRLRISWEISHAVSYLHSAFPRPIIHRDLKPDNVFLDQHNAAKLADFSLSVSIPQGKTLLELNRIEGTYGYMAPEYAMFGRVMEKSDVYSFGMLLLALLTGKRYRDWESRLLYAEPGAEFSVSEYSDSESFRSAILPVMKCADSEGLAVVPVIESFDTGSPGPIVVAVTEYSENESPCPAVVPVMRYADNGSSHPAVLPVTEYSDNILESAVTISVTNSDHDEPVPHQYKSIIVKVQEFIKDNINEIILGYKAANIDEDLFHQQLRASMDLILRCIEDEESDRPTMEEVTTELKNIITSSASLITTASTSTCLQ